MLQSQIKGDQSAKRRPADAGVLWPGKHAIFALHERLHFFNEKFCVAIRAPASELRHMRGRIFAHTRFCVVHADNDERLDLASVDAVVGGLPNVPVLPGDEGRRAIEKILPVVKIENGKPPRGLLRVAWRGVDDEVALIAQEARSEPFVLAELSRAHGAIATRRSFASTCWP